MPALQAYLRRRAILHQQGVHISSAILTSTLQVASLSRTGNITQQGVHPWTTVTSTNEAGGSSIASRASQNPAVFVESNLEARSGLRGSLGGESGVDGHHGLRRLVSNNVGSSDILSGNTTGIIRGGIDSTDESRANVENLGSAESGGHLSPGNDTSANGAAPTAFASIGSVLPWILGSQPGGLVSLLPIFRDSREQIYDGSGQQDEFTQLSWQRGSSSEEGLRHRHVRQSDGGVS